jgi:release factor glutamine methyltransferase
VKTERSQLSLRDAIGTLTQSFREAELPTPELDARLLVLDACGLTHEAYLLDPMRDLSAAEWSQIDTRRTRRLVREPVSRILGYREFWGRRFRIGPAVLDPRPDTETLIEAALAVAQNRQKGAPLNIIDLGTGSGCILLTMLAEIPNAWGIGVDRDEAALQIARNNAANLHVVDRTAFVCSDWLEAIKGRFDLILTNPPYIAWEEIATLAPEVRHNDPHLALDGGKDGFDAYRRIIADVGQIAAPGAWVLLEIGAGQAPGIVDLFTQAGWNGPFTVYKDLAGVERVVAIMRQQM